MNFIPLITISSFHVIYHKQIVFFMLVQFKVFGCECAKELFSHANSFETVKFKLMFHEIQFYQRYIQDYIIVLLFSYRNQVIRSWWGQRRHFRYNFYRNNITKVGPYTQMAWYNSHKVGCGFSQCSTTGGTTFFRYVCNYCPV